MKSIILSYSDVGGAGRAAINIHKSLKNLDVDAQIYVKKKISNLSFVENFYNKNSFIFDAYKERINRNIGKLKKSINFSYQSPSIFPTNVSNKLNKTSFLQRCKTWINWLNKVFIKLSCRKKYTS